MTYIIVGLGNPGKEYEKTRHNVGRILIESFRKKNNLPEWENEKKKGFLISKGDIDEYKVALILPELFMNKSGVSIKSIITSKNKAEKLIVVHDDIDLGFLNHKISFGRGSAGHRGLESIIKAIGTKDFIRVRVGVSPTTPSGKIKKPKGEKRVLDFLMGDFSKKEMESIPKITNNVKKILETIVKEGRVSAMNIHN